MVSWAFLFLVPHAWCFFHENFQLNGRQHSTGLYRQTPKLWKSVESDTSGENGPQTKTGENDIFQDAMTQLGFDDVTQKLLKKKLKGAGFANGSELIFLARDFVDRPEVFSTLLISDFEFPPLLAHKTRAAVMEIINMKEFNTPSTSEGPIKGVKVDQVGRQDDKTKEKSDDWLTYALQESEPLIGNTVETEKKPLFKSVIVNEVAQKRRSCSISTSSSPDTSREQEKRHAYGLPSNYATIYPTLAKELDEFFSFMTRPSILSQDAPIRKATADVYMRHAKLFLGWYVSQNDNNCHSAYEIMDGSDLSLFVIIKDKEKESADVILDFIMYLRSSRDISVSYEANLLRGLTKLLKFRFKRESDVDVDYGGKSFDDIPLIREMRKHHRQANKKQRISSRSSDEERKWLSWPEYLSCVETMKVDLKELIAQHEQEHSRIPENKGPTKKKLSSQRKVAIAYQHYLVLALFACIPDRQRTMRELEIGTSFVKDGKNDSWVVKHGPDHYKTGKTYGERVLMVSKELSPFIDDFLKRWRPALKPKTEKLFVQPRTGNPLTQDSVYQIVGRSCYKYTGKRTNPHLLRDMIVTHVREGNASEKELEALALYMGHSIQMQRTSYDRRTVAKKVAPAVALLQSVNNFKQ